MRRKFLWLLKNTLNRATARSAKKGRGPFSVLRHTGRKSGTTYETPIIVARVAKGFIAELTYGENVNWYRNIVAAGGCELIVGGLPHPGEATVQVLKGRVTLRFADVSGNGSPGDLLIVPDGKHTLDAVEDSVVLLTVVKLA